MTTPRFKPTLASSAILAALLGMAPPAQAQSSAAGQPVPVSIRAQPLSQALQDLARQTEMELIVRPELVAGRSAPGVSGSLTASQALDRLLQGSGLIYRIDGRAIVISGDASPSSGAVMQEGELAAIVVQPSADASAAGLLREYAGGQVARGSRVGILGSKDLMDTPFSTSSYTNQLIQNQQARSVADVVTNDPSVRTARGFGNFSETYFIRGFLTYADDIAYNGLYGLLPRQYTAAEMIERVEILRGADAFLYGAAPSGMGIGGTINILPKRASSRPLNQVTLGTASGGQLYTAADFSRRFGDKQNMGIRVNLARRDGDTAIDRESARLDLATIGLDWRNDRLRLSADIGYQNNRIKGMRPSVNIDAVDAVPRMPDGKTNYAQPWTRLNEEDIFGTIRAEYDFTDSTTAWIAGGMRRGKEFNSLAGVSLTDADTGAGTTYRFDNRRQDDVKTGEIGLRTSFDTGPINHQVVASASWFDHKERNAVIMDFTNLHDVNIYDPILIERPSLDNPAFVGGDINNPALRDRTRMSSFTIGDTMSMLDDRLEITLGLRHQRMRHNTYAYLTAIPEPGGYDDSRTSPVAGVVYKINDGLSVYANYIESLARGSRAPDTHNNLPVTNGGQLLPPFVSKQQEIGVKYDSGSFGASLALFTTKKPNAYLQDNGGDYTYTSSGKDRHRGAELSLYGEPIAGLRLLGGVTLLDAKQVSTDDPATSGKRVIGVPRQQATLGVEWDVPSVTGLSVDARAIATGSRYADAQNTKRVPGWVRFDLGARYVAELPGDRLLTLRARVENVMNRDYWASVGGYPGSGYLVLGNPRTFMLNASLEF